MYENFYGFNEKPFSIVPNPSFLYMSPKHQNALTYLEYGLTEGAGYILLTGEIGTGKTTLIRHILNQVENDIEVAVIFNTNVSSDQLLNLILIEFELTPEDSKAKALDMLNQFLIKKYTEDKRVLLIIDESQNLSNEALDEIRMLSNLHSDDQMLIQVVLVGQPELRANLRKPGLSQLTQRIAVNYHLSALTREETESYIKFRLNKVDGRPDIFTPEAVDVISQTSGGIPRTINLICDSALVYGFADELETIDASVVEQAIQTNGGLGIEQVTDNVDQDLVQPEQSNNGQVIQRIDTLKSSVRELRIQLDRKMKELERIAGGFKDELVNKLKGQFLDERERNDKLLVGYARLKEKYESLKNKQEKYSKSPHAQIANDKENDQEMNDSWMNIRNWFKL